MSNNNDIRESLLAIGDLLKQLTEEVVSLADCFMTTMKRTSRKKPH